MPVLKNTILSEVLNRLTVEIDNDMEIFILSKTERDSSIEKGWESWKISRRARARISPVVVGWAPRRTGAGCRRLKWLRANPLNSVWHHIVTSIKSYRSSLTLG